MAAEKEFYVQLGLLIRKARVTAGLTQQELADALTISRTSLTNIEKGNQRLLVHVLIDVADFLGIKPIQLLPSSIARPRPEESPRATTVKAKRERDFLTSILTRATKRKK